LATAEGDILENISLIENLERSKALSTEINEKVEISKVTEVAINEASEFYRPAASRGALVFFLMNDLPRIHAFYKFSLDAFIIVIRRAITKVADADKKAKQGEKEEGEGEGEEAEEGAEAEPAEKEEDEEEEVEAEMTPRTLAIRVDKLTDSITYEAFNYVRRGTFERHKLIIATMLTFRINIRKGLIDPNEVTALVNKEVALEPPNQTE
jgi:dynein heavy chain